MCASLLFHPDFVNDYGCDHNKIWVCGSFLTDEHGQSFRDSFENHYQGHDDNLALVVVPDDDFCKAFPGAVVSVKSYDYTSKYDHTWTYTSGWKPNTCKSCDIDVTYTCPMPPAVKPGGCGVCFEWALSKCDNFYQGAVCDNALDSINAALEHAGEKGRPGGAVVDRVCLVVA